MQDLETTVYVEEFSSLDSLAVKSSDKIYLGFRYLLCSGIRWD